MHTEHEMKEAPIEWPSPEWGLEWARQATETTMEGALAYARTRLAGLAGLTCGLTSQDLVHEAIVATCDGVIRWRPDRVSLCAHLCDRVRVMLRRMRRDASRAVQLDHLSPDDDDGTVIEEVGLAYTPDVGHAVDVRAAARSIEAALWRLASGDQPALAFMNAIAGGADDDQDIATVAGLSVGEVRAARRRLRRLVRTLPAALRQDARSLMT